MKKLMLSAAALMCGTMMFAQFNTSDVDQTGNGNGSNRFYEWFWCRPIWR